MFLKKEIMLQRVQSLYMFLMFLLNIIIVISLDSDPTASLPDSYFGYFRPYVENYFFAEISAMIILINIKNNLIMSDYSNIVLPYPRHYRRR